MADFRCRSQAWNDADPPNPSWEISIGMQFMNVAMMLHNGVTVTHSVDLYKTVQAFTIEDNVQPPIFQGSGSS